jgi:hypothetical protein
VAESPDLDLPSRRQTVPPPIGPHHSKGLYTARLCPVHCDLSVLLRTDTQADPDER